MSAYDIEYDPQLMDISTPRGFVVAMVQVMNLEPGSGLTLAPVCSSWVWMWFGNQLAPLSFGLKDSYSWFVA